MSNERPAPSDDGVGSGGALMGRIVLLTRRREHGAAFARVLERRGARVRWLPLLELRPAADQAALDAVLGALDGFDLVVFSSRNGVEFAHRQWRRLGAPGTWPGVACVGAGTAAAARDRALEVCLVPEHEHAEGLLEALRGRGVSGRRILLLQADNARRVLAEGLVAAGAQTVAVAAYRSIDLEPQAIPLDDVDAVCFASSETVRRFARLPWTPRRWPPTVAIGPRTAATLGELGHGPAAVAARADPDALADAVAEAVVRAP